MPGWILPLFALLFIVLFVGYAFRQGFKVKPRSERPHSDWMNINEP